jgi:uncharacterized protein (UPF0147 family)
MPRRAHQQPRATATTPTERPTVDAADVIALLTDWA